MPKGPLAPGAGLVRLISFATVDNDDDPWGADGDIDMVVIPAP